MNEYLEKTTGIFEVRGAAGAGKTYRLIQDINQLSKNSGKIRVISYSNAAVNEIKTRLLNENVRVSTIHSFCWELMQQISEKLVQTLYMNPHINLFKEFKANDLDSLKRVIYGEFGVERWDQEKGKLYLSHDDVINLFCESVLKIPAFRKLLATSIDYVLIDEFQDTSGPFLESLFKLESELVIGLYGDPFQTIYLNKDSIDMHEVRMNHDVTTNHLTCNYRSGRELVGLFNEVREKYDGLKQVAKILEESEIKVFWDRQELDYQRIKEKIGNISEECVFLSATNFLRLGLEEEDIKNSIRKLKKYFNYGWSELVDIDSIPGEANVLFEYSNFLFENGFESANAMQFLFTTESIKNVGFQRIRELRDYMYGNKKTDINILLSKGLTLKKQISEFEEHINFFDFKEFKAINYLYLNLENMDKDNLTIYKAKGLEFDNVILNIDTGGFWQKNWSKVNFNHSENDQREPEDVMNYLFYVGITRAKKRLFIYVNTATTGEFLSKLKTTFPNLEYIKA